MYNLTDFDPTIYTLGVLCGRGHEWQNTGKSVRNFNPQKKPGNCVVCRGLKVKLVDITDPEILSELGVRPGHFLGAVCKRNHTFQGIPRTEKELKTKRCFECHKLKSYESRSRTTLAFRRQLGRNNYYNNLEKRRKTQNEWKKKTGWTKLYRQTEKGKAIQTKDYNRRRAVKKQVLISLYSTKDLQNRFKEFNGLCAYCDQPSTSIDHFIPISFSGADCLSNLIPACLFCNSSKGNRHAASWYASQPFYSKQRWAKILKVLGKSEKTIDQMTLF